MKLVSYGHLQLYIKHLQYIFASVHQINIHQNTQNLTCVIKLCLCRPYGKDFKIPFHKQLWESEQPVKDLTTGIETAPSDKEKPRILCTHDQHTADYIRLMIEEGMDLPMWGRQGSSIDYRGITIDLPFLCLSAFHH